MKSAPFFLALAGGLPLLVSACADQPDSPLKWLAQQQAERPVGPAFHAAPKPVPTAPPPALAVTISPESGAAPIIAEAPRPVAPPPVQAAEAPPPVKPAPPPPPPPPKVVAPPPASPPPVVKPAPAPPIAEAPPPPPPPAPVQPAAVQPAPAPVVAPPQLAALPPPVPPKPHPHGPIANPDDLIGLSTEQLLIRLGQPNLKRHETPAELWQYHSPLCLLELRLRPDNNVLKVAETALKPHAGQSPTAAQCLGALNAALRPDGNS